MLLRERRVSSIPSLPDRMRAVVYRERGRLEVEQRPLPRLGPTDVLLEVSHCGVCGTDLHMVMEGWGRPNSIGGHEYSGRVAALGSEVRAWEIGDRVVGGPEPGCGACGPCLSHRPGLCSQRPSPGVDEFQGAFAEYMKLDASQALRTPDELGLREAALAEPLAVALHAVTLGAAPPGARALVTGAGPIGALTLAALRARGIEDVSVSEPLPLRRKLALELGASAVLEPAALEVPPMPFSQVEGACDVAFECSGSPDAFEAALAQLRPTGRLVIVGSGMRRPQLDANRILLNELSVTGAYCYDENGVEDALALLASGRLPTDRLIEAEDVPLEGVADAMRRLIDGRLGAKVMVAPADPDHSASRGEPA
jgi:(R,R)-butanediol dehydrogenase/meso-butanediol dehydrogenase/diacetyl reductase